jgi:hypothetical protein
MKKNNSIIQSFSPLSMAIAIQLFKTDNFTFLQDLSKRVVLPSSTA